MSGGFAGSKGFIVPFRAKKSFYSFPVTNIIGRDEGHGLAAILSACGSSDTMDVILGVVGHVVVDDERYVRHIDTACHDIGRHQHCYLTVTEIQHHLITLVLLEIGVHGVRVYLEGT